MKYSIEIKNGIAKETLLFNGKVYNKTTKKTSYGSCSDDMEFNEQMEDDGVDNDVLEQVFDTLDSFLADNLLDIAESEDKE